MHLLQKGERDKLMRENAMLQLQLDSQRMQYDINLGASDLVCLAKRMQQCSAVKPTTSWQLAACLALQKA